MNILFLCRFPLLPHYGGIERVSFLLASEFNRRGHNITAAYTSSLQVFSQPDSLPFHQYPLHPDCQHSVYELSKIISSHNIDIIINQIIDKKHLDLLNGLDRRNVRVISVLHNKPFPLYGVERKAKKLTNPISVRGKLLRQLAILSPMSYRIIRNSFDRKIYSAAIKLSDKFFLLSEKYLNPIMSSIPSGDFSKVDAINNPNTFSTPDNQVFHKENIIIWVGRLIDPQKNLKDFIDFWSIFNAIHPGWKALIIGDGPHRETFENYAKEKAVNNLDFIGNQKDISPFYSKAKFLCMTSLYEGWPMVIPEAMAYGTLPVVFDTFQALTDLIEHRRNGLIIKAFDTHQMAMEIDFILNLPEEALYEMGQNAIKSIRNYDIKKIADIWISKMMALNPAR